MTLLMTGQTTDPTACVILASRPDDHTASASMTELDTSELIAIMIGTDGDDTAALTSGWWDVEDDGTVGVN